MIQTPEAQSSAQAILNTTTSALQISCGVVEALLARINVTCARQDKRTAFNTVKPSGGVPYVAVMWQVAHRMSLKDLSRLFGEVSICDLGVVDKASGPHRSSPKD